MEKPTFRLTHPDNTVFHASEPCKPCGFETVFKGAKHPELLLCVGCGIVRGTTRDIKGVK